MLFRDMDIHTGEPPKHLKGVAFWTGKLGKWLRTTIYLIHPCGTVNYNSDKNKKFKRRAILLSYFYFSGNNFRLKRCL